jgi:hypothetical protein
MCPALPLTTAAFDLVFALFYSVAAGMSATYHRVLKPHTYTAAIASSAPNDYVIGTKGWATSSNNYHVRIADSLNMNSGSSECASTVRQGLAEVMRLSKSATGRRKLGEVFNMCNASAVLASDKDGYNFFNDQYGQYHGYAQVGTTYVRVTRFQTIECCCG